jgi:hypothetical protein
MIRISLSCKDLLPLIAPPDAAGAIGGLVERTSASTFVKTAGKVLEMIPAAVIAGRLNDASQNLGLSLTDPAFVMVLAVPVLIAAAKEISRRNGYEGIAKALTIADRCFITTVRVIGIAMTAFIVISLFAEGAFFLGTAYLSILAARVCPYVFVSSSNQSRSIRSHTPT